MSITTLDIHELIRELKKVDALLKKVQEEHLSPSDAERRLNVRKRIILQEFKRREISCQ